ncbi:MAG: hypothetical protein K8T89_00935 [Planctomycetes bacterium]|nr:hypothetical protein [Planctomycetota bacterium]
MENSKIAKFALGQVVSTPSALRALEASGQSAAEFLDRHAAGDWGVVCEGDWQLNDEALQSGERLLSAYLLASGVKLWIITEAGRSSTCLLLPSEY